LNYRGVEISQDEIASFCRRWKITEVALFGSILREDFRPDSDVDILVTFAPDAKWRFYDLIDMQAELEAMLGRQVDLVERRLVENSENYIRRKHILEHSETIYVAGSRLGS
jgi:predicted nucleotidyltransferase